MKDTGEAMQHMDSGGSCDIGSLQRLLAKGDPDSADVWVLDCSLQSHEHLPPAIEASACATSSRQPSG